MKLSADATAAGGVRMVAALRLKDAAPLPLPLDYSALRAHRTPWEVLSGHAGYRPPYH